MQRVAVSVVTYRADPLYPRIVRVVGTILEQGKVVAPVDVLVGMGLLRPEHLEDWRRGRVPYLERVIASSLTRLSRVLRILRFHAHDLKLVPRVTVYTRRGKGPRQRLCFTKTGDAKLEEAYARHFVWPGKGPFHLPERQENREIVNDEVTHASDQGELEELEGCPALGVARGCWDDAARRPSR